MTKVHELIQKSLNAQCPIKTNFLPQRFNTAAKAASLKIVQDPSIIRTLFGLI